MMNYELFRTFVAMKRILLLFFACFLSFSAVAQGDWRDALQRWLMTEDMEESYSEETMEWLEERAASPINLNQTTREELEQLPFLSALQVEQLVEYLDRYRPMRSFGELLMIRDLDPDTRRLLQCFVYVGEPEPKRIWPTLDNLLHDGKHTLMATGKIPFYKRRGDENGYLGYPYRHDLRYQYNYHNRVKFGLTAAQDAGEPFFKDRNRMGYDHYSYYLQLRDMGRLEEFNLGMYRVQLGMGLLMNTGFHLGKLATLQTMGRSTRTLTAHSSRSVAGYMQGAAATVRLARHWRVTAFASLRYLDVTLNTDETVRTLITSGYHRTPTEMEKKNNTRETDLGGCVGWRSGTLYVNANAVYTAFNRDLSPLVSTPASQYRRYAAAGNNFFNASLDYGYNNHRWTFAGETAVNRRGALALLHTLGVKVSNYISLTAIHRYYDKRYTALHGRSFGENTGVQNEHGIYLGATWQPTTRWQVQGYVDYAHFPWLRYQVSSSSDAFDALLNVRYTGARWTLSGRYRYHIRQRDDSKKENILNKTDQRLRLQALWTLSPQWSLQTQADGVITEFEGQRSRGIMVSEHVTWQWRWLKTDAHIGWFRSDDYDSRLYQYEASVLYDYGYPAYYGHGLHWSLMLRAALGARLSAAAKVSVTDYFDRDVIGSGLQQINRSSMTDLLLQLRWQF